MNTPRLSPSGRRLPEDFTTALVKVITTNEADVIGEALDQEQIILMTLAGTRSYQLPKPTAPGQSITVKEWAGSTASISISVADGGTVEKVSGLPMVAAHECIRFVSINLSDYTIVSGIGIP